MNDPRKEAGNAMNRREAVKTLGGLGLTGLAGRFGAYAPTARATKRRLPEGARANANYVFNRAPLPPNPYAELPLGAVKPRGWLLEQLQRMADGMAGRLDELYPNVGTGNAWVGGDGDVWERGPYWLDGLVPLAYTLGDQALIDKAQPWIDWTLESQQPNGYFGPQPGRNYRADPEGKSGAFLQTDNAGDWWPRAVMLKALRSYHSATGDERVPPFITGYFRYQLETLPRKPLDHWTWWAEMRGGENQASVYWLYNRTGDAFLLDLASLLFEQTADWTAGFRSTELPSTHAVNVAMGVKQPAMGYLQTNDEAYLRAVEEGLRVLMGEHGQPQGLFSGDEHLHGMDPTQGTELCTVVELMYSLETLTCLTGDLRYADHLEKVAYNALPTQHTDDYMGRQYFQQPNQIRVNVGQHNFITTYDDALCYGLVTGYPCCTVNMHQGWPKYVRHLWLATHDGGLAALFYGASEVEARVADGVAVRFEEQTAYPFDEAIRFAFSSGTPVNFPLHLRIPGWMEGQATLRINGEVWSRPEGGQVVKVRRVWQDGDTVELTLPMSIRTHGWHENSISVERGPLVYGLYVEGDWQKIEGAYTPDWVEEYEVPAWEVRPKGPWNYGLLIDSEQLDGSFEVVREEGGAYPWSAETVPIKLTARGRRIDWWKEYNGEAGPLPYSPVRSDSPVEEVTLIPYGATTLRISEFPTVEE